MYLGEQKTTKIELARELVARKWKGAKNPPSARLQEQEAEGIAKNFSKPGLQWVLSSNDQLKGA